MATQVTSTTNTEHIYRSPHPPVQYFPRQSVWSFCFDARGIDPSIPAYIDSQTGRSLTRAQTRSLTLELAYGLRNLMPFGERVYRGDTVLVFSPNSIAWVVAAYGIIANGSRLTPANSGYTARELLHQYTDSHARAMFIHPSLIPVALDMFKLLGVPEPVARKRMIVMEPGYGQPEGLIGMQDLLGKGTLEHEERFDGKDSNETFLICYSSGTTGKPKGVETTHFNYTSELSITDHCFRIYSGKDVILATLPFYHILGINKLMSHPLAVGVPTVVLSKFHPNDFCRSIERFGVTAAVIVPPIVLALTYHPAASNFNIKTLRYLHSAAAPLSQESIEAAVERLGKSGAQVDIGQGYGLTEMSPNSHWTPTAAANQMRGTIGNLQPNLEARLVISEAEDGEALEEAPVGGPGELWIRGPIVMKGYLNNEAATTKTITKSGWLKTGDIAVVDDQGRWKIVDRKKELIKYKGFQVPPAELEGILLQHPDIIDAAVIGVEDPKLGTELPRAYIVHKDGASGAPPTFPQDIQKWIQTQVADHKFLRGGVVLIDAVPKSQAGKILRRELRDRAKAEYAAAKSKL